MSACESRPRFELNPEKNLAGSRIGRDAGSGSRPAGAATLSITSARTSAVTLGAGAGLVVDDSGAVRAASNQGIGMHMGGTTAGHDHECKKDFEPHEGFVRALYEF